MGPAWTRSARLPGGDLPDGSMKALLGELTERYPKLDAALIAGLARRHGSATSDILGDAETMGDLGRHMGEDLYEREIAHFKRHEWAVTAEDVLWRRTKVGLHLSSPDRDKATALIEALL